MAKYKLTKSIANSQSFRFEGVKYVTRFISDKQLKELYKKECPFVIEEKPKPSKKKSNEKEESAKDTE